MFPSRNYGTFHLFSKYFHFKNLNFFLVLKRTGGVEKFRVIKKFLGLVHFRCRNDYFLVRSFISSGWYCFYHRQGGWVALFCTNSSFAKQPAWWPFCGSHLVTIAKSCFSRTYLKLLSNIITDGRKSHCKLNQQLFTNEKFRRHSSLGLKYCERIRGKN